MPDEQSHDDTKGEVVPLAEVVVVVDRVGTNDVLRIGSNPSIEINDWTDASIPSPVLECYEPLTSVYSDHYEHRYLG